MELEWSNDECQCPFFVPIFMGAKIGNDTETEKGVDIRDCLVETKKHTKR